MFYVDIIQLTNIFAVTMNFEVTLRLGKYPGRLRRNYVFYLFVFIEAGVTKFIFKRNIKLLNALTVSFNRAMKCKHLRHPLTDTGIIWICRLLRMKSERALAQSIHALNPNKVCAFTFKKIPYVFFIANFWEVRNPTETPNRVLSRSAVLIRWIPASTPTWRLERRWRPVT